MDGDIYENIKFVENYKNDEEYLRKYMNNLHLFHIIKRKQVLMDFYKTRHK